MPSPVLTREDVAAVFESYPAAVREKLLDIRQLVFDTAATTEGVGEIEEALRWGEPSYLTRATQSGSTIRLSTVRGADDQIGIYFNCQTTLVETFRQMYPDRFTFSGNRAIIFHVEDCVPVDELRHCIALALCYHLDKRSRAVDAAPWILSSACTARPTPSSARILTPRSSAR